MKFDAPGFLKDFEADAAEFWSAWMSDEFDAASTRDGSGEWPPAMNVGPRPQFFNPSKTPVDPDAVEKDITWSAFPRKVEIGALDDSDRWQTADNNRLVQDEYCEWSVTRDARTRKITRVTFTSEGPEYWEKALAVFHPDRVLALYREHISPDVQESDLFRRGRYLPQNRWNNSTTNGAMHLIQGANTLHAEIELAAAATIVRRLEGRILTDAQELIRCAIYGDAKRHSDPNIGASVNELARMNADITLANPVGLYIAELSVAGWRTPDGSNPADYWTITRGTTEKAVRAVYAVPPSKGFVVGDIRIGNKAIEFGAQIADFITIKLTGLATRVGQSRVEPVEGCVGLLEARGLPAVAEVLASQAFSHRGGLR